MKKFKKTITACIAVSLLVLTGVFQTFAAQIDPETESALSSIANEQVLMIFETSDADLDMYVQYCLENGDTFSAEVFQSAKETRAKYGEFQSTGTPVVTENENGVYAISLPISFTNGNSIALIEVDGNTGYITGFSFKDAVSDEKQSLGKLMKDASVNLIVGMGTVFAVLIFLCWVISLFKYIHAAEEKLRRKNEGTKAGKEPVVKVESVSSAPQTDDEIQAVIAAAIAAYEAEAENTIVKQGALANGKNIRSYRR